MNLPDDLKDYSAPDDPFQLVSPDVAIVFLVLGFVLGYVLGVFR